MQLLVCANSDALGKLWYVLLFRYDNMLRNNKLRTTVTYTIGKMVYNLALFYNQALVKIDINSINGNGGRLLSFQYSCYFKT